MAWKVHRKYVLRRKKARRNQRNRALFWVWGGSDLIYSDEVPYGRTQVSRTVYELEEDEHGELRSVERRRSYTHLYRDLAHFNRLTAEEFWALRDRWNAEQRRYHERRLHLSQETHSRGGGKWAKRKYHRLRRTQSRRLCHYALKGDERRFESIPNCDYFRGRIGWDLH